MILGARPDGGVTTFRVWAPDHEQVEVVLDPDGAARTLPLTRDALGYHATLTEGAPVGTRYVYALGDGTLRPDPASRWQPDGPHGASAVVDPGFDWHDDGFRPPALSDLVLYELHVGTFTREGTFDAVVPELPALRELGVTAIELMPVAEFPGGRNWGYDGVLPFAAQSTYGGPDGLRRLVAAAHDTGLAVLLDVVFNHLGPEGNHLRDFGPYFTDRYATPWGAALNFDGAGSDEVRRYFVESARWWTAGCHVDGLRLDAVHAIVDPSAHPFVEQLTETLHEDAARSRRPCVVIAESSANDARLVREPAAGGVGLDGVWADDLHHAIHVSLTGERTGYYADYEPVTDLARALAHAWVYDGRRRSRFRGCTFGSDPAGIPTSRFVVCAQNHDQIGNRAEGDRLVTGAAPGAAEVAAAAVLLAPFLPLLFMGEEYGETAPFPYFVSHGDPELVAAVRRGRATEFAELAGVATPDPQDPATFRSAVLDRTRAASGPGARRRAWYRALLGIRAEHPACRSTDPRDVHAEATGDAVVLRRRHPDGDLVVVLHTGEATARVPLPAADRRVLADSGAEGHAGTGTATASVSDLEVHGHHAVVLAELR